MCNNLQARARAHTHTHTHIHTHTNTNTHTYTHARARALAINYFCISKRPINTFYWHTTPYKTYYLFLDNIPLNLALKKLTVTLYLLDSVLGRNWMVGEWVRARTCVCVCVCACVREFWEGGGQNNPDCCKTKQLPCRPTTSSLSCNSVSHHWKHQKHKNTSEEQSPRYHHSQINERCCDCAYLLGCQHFPVTAFDRPQSKRYRHA
jgi:hypothetical protein